MTIIASSSDNRTLSSMSIWQSTVARPAPAIFHYEIHQISPWKNQRQVSDDRDLELSLIGWRVMRVKLVMANVGADHRGRDRMFVGNAHIYRRWVPWVGSKWTTWTELWPIQWSDENVSCDIQNLHMKSVYMSEKWILCKKQKATRISYNSEKYFIISIVYIIFEW